MPYLAAERATHDGIARSAECAELQHVAHLVDHLGVASQVEIQSKV
jgi:hypothetical protein